ncbi:OLC1v1032275C2 [Oldenlandia corymbosa var. corymbosa]|uniref:OLC1v1032275C2 n=1 Tax=Oldenlandia corymbosa var. corymbosa TaxID=529605 RepID=A0AAV1CNA7_OLDCO|nr:OLC1v1032275C2 [Oldenlandia corymbosa var. corymbosa]
MRSEENPLDLNNLPEDYNRDGGYRKKKSGGNKDGKDDGKVYECRFCSLKFCKSQALGGHMNRHRQERETETLNRARQLVFTTDSLLGQGPLPHHHHHHHLGGQPIPTGGYHHHHPAGNLNDPSMHFRSMYPPPTRLFSDSTTAATTLLPPPPPPPYMYPSPTRLVPLPATHYPATTDYFLGHVVPTNTTNPENSSQSPINNYTCIGAPVNIGPQGIPSLGNNNYDHEGGAGLSWGRGSCTAAGGGGGGGGGTTGTTQHHHHQQQKNRFDPTLINRFQDGF